jgi:hypothetical protein
MRKFLILGALLLTAQAPAPTDTIDYLVRFTTPALALAAAELAGVVIPGPPATFSGAQVASVQVFKTTAITPYDPTTAPNCPCETNAPIATGVFYLVSTQGVNAAIAASPALVLMADRTLACQGALASAFLLTNNTGYTVPQLGYGGPPSASTPTLHIGGGFPCDPGTAKFPSSNPYGLGGGK